MTVDDLVSMRDKMLQSNNCSFNHRRQEGVGVTEDGVGLMTRRKNFRSAQFFYRERKGGVRRRR